jgi:hypothetical protein
MEIPANKCMWEGDGHREKTEDLGKLYLLVEKWVASDLRHRMHHAFPGRFKSSLRFPHRPLSEAEKKAEDWIESLE